MLQSHAAIQKCEEGKGIYLKMRKKHANMLFNYIWFNSESDSYLLASHNTTLNESNQHSYNMDIRKVLIEFRDEVIKINDIYRYHGQDCIQDTSWIIESSLLFSMTLLTTIGDYESLICFYFIQFFLFY
jgi:hypothetical protein